MGPRASSHIGCAMLSTFNAQWPTSSGRRRAAAIQWIDRSRLSARSGAARMPTLRCSPAAIIGRSACHHGRKPCIIARGVRGVGDEAGGRVEQTVASTRYRSTAEQAPHGHSRQTAPSATGLWTWSRSPVNRMTPAQSRTHAACALRASRSTGVTTSLPCSDQTRHTPAHAAKHEGQATAYRARRFASENKAL